MSLPQVNLLHRESPMKTSFALDTLIISAIKYLKKDVLNKSIYDLSWLFIRRLTSNIDLQTLWQWLSATISSTAARPI